MTAAIDTITGVRQFENSAPGARAPLGRSDNYPRSVAGRLGAAPARAMLDGRRFVARGDDRGPALADLLSSAAEPIGERVYVRPSGSGNRVTPQPLSGRP